MFEDSSVCYEGVEVVQAGAPTGTTTAISRKRTPEPIGKQKMPGQPTTQASKTISEQPRHPMMGTQPITARTRQPIHLIGLQPLTPTSHTLRSMMKKAMPIPRLWMKHQPGKKLIRMSAVAMSARWRRSILAAPWCGEARRAGCWPSLPGAARGSKLFGATPDGADDYSC